MPVPPFEQLMRPITSDEYLASELSIAQQLELPVTAWQPASIGREVLYINAAMLEGQSVALTPIARGGLLEYAEGVWLTLLAEQVYSTIRIPSSYATGPIRLTNSRATPHTFAPGDVRVLNETSGKTYTSTSGGTLGGNGTLTLQFSADEPGTASNLTSTDTLSLVTAIPGVTPSYVAELIGQDQESNEALRQRCRESNAAASPNGPGDAYSYFAKSTLRPDGSNVGVTRTNVVEGNGTVTVYVADADGLVIPSDVDLIQENINAHVVPTGFTVITQSAALHVVSIAMTLTMSPSATASQSELEARITDAINEYFSSIPVGGNKALSFQGVYLSTLITLARVACGDNVVDVVIDLPSADVPLLDNEVPVSAAIIFTWEIS